MHRVLWLVRGGSGAEEGVNGSFSDEERKLLEVAVEEVIEGEKPMHRIGTEKDVNRNSEEHVVVGGASNIRSQQELRDILKQVRKLGVKIEGQRWAQVRAGKRERAERKAMRQAELSTRARNRYVCIARKRQDEKRVEDERWLQKDAEEEKRVKMLLFKKRQEIGLQDREQHERCERETMRIEEERQRKVVRKRVVWQIEQDKKAVEEEWLEGHMESQRLRKERERIGEQERERQRKTVEEKKAKQRLAEEYAAVKIQARWRGKTGRHAAALHFDSKQEKERQRRKAQTDMIARQRAVQNAADTKREAAKKAAEKAVKEARRITRAAVRSIGRFIKRAEESAEEAQEIATAQEEARLAQEHEGWIAGVIEQELKPKLKKEKAVKKQCKKMGLEYGSYADIDAAYRGIAETLLADGREKLNLS